LPEYEPLTIKTRQYLAFTVIMVLTMVLTTAAYRLTGRKWILYRNGESLFFAEQFSEAIPLLSQAIQSGVKQPEAALYLADAFMATRKFEDAMSVYQALICQVPDHEAALWRLSGLYEQFGRFQDALTMADRLLKKNPQDTSVMLRMARLYQNIQSYTQAENLYRILVSRVPNFIHLQMELAETLTLQKKYTEAALLYQDILTNHPHNRSARIQLARMLFWSDRPDDAISEYSMALGENL
jgi:tetratricopeptide (TPR) repeat protein